MPIQTIPLTEVTMPYDRRAAARYLGISTRALDKLVAARLLLGSRPTKGRLIFRQAELHRHLRATADRPRPRKT